MRALRKIVRDLWLTRGRTLFMVAALAAGLTSMGAVLQTRGVVYREMTRAYRASVPASATFDVGERGLSDDELRALAELPEVAAAERRTTRAARWRRREGERWGRALLFVSEDFAAQRLARLEHEAGARAPGAGEVLVERSAMRVLGAEIGDRVQLTLDGRRAVWLTIAGVTHEAALAPAATEQAGYFYVTPATLARLAPGAALDEIRVLVADSPLSLPAVEAQVERVAAWMSARGIALHEIRVPTPGEHPHQAPSEGVLLLFAIFAGLTVVLAAVLTASLLSITLARQVREVAVMKTLGARRSHIAGLYALMLLVVAASALVLSLGPTFALARLGMDAVAGLLNFDIASYRVPHAAVFAQVATGLLLPLGIATPTIRRASRRSVRDALDDHGVRVEEGRLARAVGDVGDRLTRAALRNTLRKPGRLVLTLGLLAAGGGLFVTALSTASSWDALVDEVWTTRHYDVDFRLSTDATVELARELPGATTAEVWGSAPVTLQNAAGLPISRTYPDGGHGSFTLIAAPDETELVDFSLRAGRWLKPGELHGVVLNQLAAKRVGADAVGRTSALVVEGRTVDFVVVGVVDEVAAPARAYVSTRAFRERVGATPRELRVAFAAGREPTATAAAIERAQATLSRRGAAVRAAVPLTLLYNAMGEHVVVLINSLLVLALMMAIVGVLALASTMSASVVERTRELGVLRAIGARPAQLRRMILLEGAVVTLASVPLALALAIPLTAGVGDVVGRLSFELPLPLSISWAALAAWSVGVVAVSALASVVPARAAARLTVREALAHV